VGLVYESLFGRADILQCKWLETSFEGRNCFPSTAERRDEIQTSASHLPCHVAEILINITTKGTMLCLEPGVEELS
jgi:hypothetical protein